MKFLVEIPDKDVRKALKGGRLKPQTLVRYSLEENFGKPGAKTIGVWKLELIKTGKLADRGLERLVA